MLERLEEFIRIDKKEQE